MQLRIVIFSALVLAMPVHVVRAAPQRIVVVNAKILTMAPDSREPVDGFMKITDGRITEIGSGAPRATSGEVRVDAGGHWVVPGFVSAHSHLWQSRFAGIAADANLEGWLGELYGVVAPTLTPSRMRELTKLGAQRHLCHGVTTAFNFTYNVKNANQSQEMDRQQFLGAIDSELRFVHAIGIRRIGPDWSIAQAATHLKSFLDWASTFDSTARYLKTAINGEAIYAFITSPAQANAEGALMKRFGLINQQHYLESPGSSPLERERFSWLENAGMLGPHLILGHFVHADDDILKRSAAAGVAATWNPMSNGRLGSGIPDIPRYIGAGMNIGMGVDGEASADRADPFENMRSGLYQMRAQYQDASIMDAYRVLYSHTLGAARILAVDRDLGSLEPGKWADFVIVKRREQLTTTDAYASLVFSAATQDIIDVYVGGKPSMARACAAAAL